MLSLLRDKFELALLAWLRSAISLPIDSEQCQTLNTLRDCCKQLVLLESYDPYWPYATHLFESLAHGNLPDQISARKLAAKLNLALAKKKYNEPTRVFSIPKELWKTTISLQAAPMNTKLSLQAIDDNFLHKADEYLNNLATQEITTKTVLDLNLSANGILELSNLSGFQLLLILAKSLSKLTNTLAGVNISTLMQMEYSFIFKKIQNSMHSLLHQAAAGTKPKVDDSFIDALFICEQTRVTLN